MSFVHLHTHTVYSLLDGFSNIKKLVRRAKEMDMPALAITDHGTMFGVVEFYNAAREVGIKPIIGVETYMAARRMTDRDPKLDKKSTHLLLLAENETGYKNLLKLVSKAQMEGFYYYPRIDHELLAEHSEGLICTSGCMSAEIPRDLLEERPEEAVRRMNWYYDVFGPDRFFIELQQHNIAEMVDLNRKLVELGARYSAKFVATNDVHYINVEDAAYQDVLLAIQTGKSLNDPERMRYESQTFYLRSPQEMSRLFAEIPEALTNTLMIAERCNVDLSFKGYHIPEFPVPEGFTAQTYLRHLCEEGLEKRYGARKNDPVIRERLDFELNVIHTMGFDSYFLIVWDLCRHARENGIWYNTRGSGAGSLVAYSLFITLVDPIEHQLLFERFLNPGRISMPDIDLDFRDDRRAEMLVYAARKYGDDRVAQIITFGTMAARGALRDVGRVLEMPIPEVDKVAKLVPQIPGKPITLTQALEEVPDLKALYDSDPKVKKLVDIAIHMEGTVRNAGTHAAGLVISDKPITEYLPIHRPTSGSEESPIKTVTQFEMGILESLGMLKVDFLGLSTLTVMARACELIKQRHGKEYDLNNIPLDDPKTFELLGEGKTAGVFQLEGCLSGDTYIGHRTIQSLYQEFLARQREGRLHGKQQLRTHSCYLDSGRFFPNVIQKVVYSGIKPVYRLTIENGVWIKATADHHFFTQRGWVKLGDLIPETDRLLFKSSASRVGRVCQDCGQPLKTVSSRSKRCKQCAARLSANPSRPEVRAKIAQKRRGQSSWNKGLTAETARDTLWMKNLSAYNATQKGVSLDEKIGPERAAQVRAKLSLRSAGKNNPMYGRPPKRTKTYTRAGYREDLGHYVRSSWEADMARVFRYLGWEYQYEPQTFELQKNGKTITYTPDFYLPEQDTFYEIKGWMDQASAEKIALFRAQYPEKKLVVIDKTRFAEFQVKYADLVAWECPRFPQETEWVRIERIEFVGEEETYDLQMQPPGNNFVANGFIVHNSGMTRYVVEMKPKNLDNIIAMVALYRPGPMDFIPSYIRRMHGEEPIEYRHPALEPIFRDTYGIPVYQEQIMRAAVEIGGFTRSESDDLRKAISKKMADKIAKNKEKFVKGAVERGIMDKETATAIFEDWEQFARYGFNKCLPGDVEVLDADSGRMVRIEELYRQPSLVQRVLSTDTEALKLRPGAVLQVMENGVKPVYRLTTALGRRIEATANHPFYTYDGWKRLDHLQAGEQIAVPRRLPVEGRTEWPLHHVIVLGHLLAEGNLCHPHSVYFYSQDGAQVQDFVQAAERFENVRCSVKMHKSTWSVYAGRRDRSRPPEIFVWAGQLGLLGKNAREKEIPAPAFELNNRQIALLLSRMWEGDGHLDPRNHSAFYATASERLARQMQHLLLRLGIVSRLRQVVFPYKEGRTGWQLFVTGCENLLAFAQTVAIHWVSEKNRQAMAALLAAPPAQPAGVKDVIPLSAKELVREARERRGVSWQTLRAESGVAPRSFYPGSAAGKHGFTRQTFHRLAAYFDDPALYRLSESDVYWDEIVSIEYVGEKQTYDLEVAEYHNFVANDIIVHNSHAADYGLVSVQTAFLKAHYPAEYMSALMSVFKDDSAKISLYIAESRSMGIEVLPPNVNYSGKDFTIEDLPGGKTAIRFGLSAVKNVGEGPVELILKGRRENGCDVPFRDLNDLAQRVDLKAVGKRALESLIKVGALDEFGERAALLEALDQLLAASASHFKAAETGQLSLFGGMSGVQVQAIVLPPTQTKKKEALAWERELIGVYLSDHPLRQYEAALTQSAITNALALNDLANGQPVQVAGLVVSSRPYKTKTEKMMGFVTLEDLTGNIELVIFPKAWEKYRALCEEGQVIFVKGKVDAATTPPKVLVDEILTELKVYVPAEEEAWRNALPAPAASRPTAQPSNLPTGKPEHLPTGEPSNRPTIQPEHRPTAQPSNLPTGKPEHRPTVQPEHLPTGEPSNRPTVEPVNPPADEPFDDLPPEPDFPDDWHLTEPDFAGPSAELPLPPPPATPMDDLLTLERLEPLAETLESPALAAPAAVQPSPRTSAAAPAGAVVLPPPIVSPQVVAEAQEEGQPPRLITITLHPSGDSERDRRRLRNVYFILMSKPGKDRFQFQIFEGGRGHLIDFPNDTTRITPDLLMRLRNLLGEECWRIEEITFR